MAHHLHPALVVSKATNPMTSTDLRDLIASTNGVPFSVWFAVWILPR
jgi:hypothetical protein